MNPTHSAFAVIYRRKPQTSELQFLVIHYRSRHPGTGELSEEEIRFPGGTNKAHRHEGPIQTAIRKLLEETGVSVTRPRVIHSKLQGGHMKYCLLANYDWSTGDLYTAAHERGGDLMSPAFWRSVAELKEIIAPVHKWLYDAACKELRVEVIF